MQFDQPLCVKHTLSATKKPLACFDLPGSDVAMFPNQMRALAAALLKAADDCDALEKHVLRYGAERRHYALRPTGQ